MGHISHRAILVTAYSDVDIVNAINEAHKMGLGDLCTTMVKGRINGYISFAVVPEGSKQGWDRQQEAEAQRQKFVDWLSLDGQPFEWVYLSYGHDDGKSKVLADNKVWKL